MNPNINPLLNDQEPGSLDAHQLEAVASQQVIGLNPQTVPVAKKIRSTTGIWTATAGLLVLGLITLIGFIFIRTNENAKTVPTPLAEFSQVTTNEINLGQLGQVDVNGVLKVNNGIILSPTTLNPADPQPGQLFLNQDTNKLEFYDGNEVKQVVTETQIVTTIGGSAGQIDVGEGLVFENNTISLENLNTTPVTPTGLQITNNSDGLIQRINGILTGGVGDRNNAQLFGGILSLANGGTGASSASGARSNIGAASSGANTDITSLSGLTTALSVFQGGTGASSLALNGVLIGGGSGSVSSLVAGSSGLCLISTSGTPSWSSCSGGGTVASVNTFTGAISIQGTTNQVNISNSSGTITLSLPQNIHTSASPQFSGLTLSGLGNGVVQSSSGVLSASAIDRNSTTLLSNDLSVVNGGTGASDAATARSNLGVASSGANSDITSLSGLTTALSVAQGGTGATTLGANGVLLGNGTGSISSVVAGGAGLCLTSTAGAPTWSSCPGSGGVSSVNTFTGAISIQGTTNQVNISNSSGTITLSLPQNLNTTSSPQFSGLTLTSNLVVQGGSATLGTTSQAGGLIIYDGSSNTGTLQTAALGQNTVYTLPDPGLASVSICLSTGNCAGLGGGVTTTGGTNGAIALFNSANNIEESILTQSGSTVTAAGNLVLQGTNSLSLGTASTNAGTIAFYNTAGANTVSLQAPSTNPASNLVFRLPVADGSSGNCLTTNGTGTLSFAACLSGAGGGSGGVSGLNGLSGSLSIANASGSLSTITIDDATTAAKGIASFSSSDFTVSSGAVSIANNAITSAKIDNGTITGTDIASSTISNSNLANSSVTVTAGTGLSGGGAVALGSSTTLSVSYGSTTGTAVQGDIVLTCPSGSGNLSGGGTNITLGLGGTCGGITTVNNPTFTTSVTSAQLILTGAGSNGTLQVANLGQSTTFTLPDPGAASATICLNTGNCAGSGTGVTTAGGSTNTLAKFTGSQAIGDSTITDNGTTVTIGANLNVTGAVTLTTPLAVAEGGTGADNATTARSNLGAASSGANSDITSLSGLTTALTVGQGGTGATTLTANGVLFGNGTGAIQATAAGSTGQCLIATTGNAPTWGSCAGGGSGVTLQAAYDNSTGGTTPEIKLDSTRGGLDIQDANSTIGGSLLTVRASNASGLGSALFDINSTGQTTLRNSTNSTSAFQIQNAAATRTLFSVDTANNRVGIGTASPGAALEISDGTDGTRFGILANGSLYLNTSNTAGDVTIVPGGDLELGTSLTDSITLGRTDQNITTTINGSVLSRSQTNSATAFQVQDAASASLFNVDTAVRSVSGGNLIKIGNSTGTDTATTILQVDSATADPTSNLSALNGGLFYNSTSNKLSIIENGTVKILCNTTDLGCGNSPTTTLQQAYDNGVAGDQIIALDSTQDSIIFRNPASSGSDSNYVLTVDQLSTGATGGLDIQSAGTGNLLRVRDTTATAQDVFTIADGGATIFRNQTNSTAAFQVQNAAGTTTVFNVDTTNSQVTLLGGSDVAVANSGGFLVLGGIASTNLALDDNEIMARNNGVASSLYLNSDGGGLYIQQGTAGTFNVNNGQMNLSSTGAASFQNGTNSATAFQIQNAAGTAQFVADTTNGGLTLGSTTGTGTITLGQSTATNTISIGSAAGASNTQTINIGTSSTGSSTTNVNIGSSAGGTTAITGPTTITNRTSGSTSSLIVSNSTSTGNIAEFRDNATDVFTLADGGAATFRNQTDSTTAFNIQNAAGTTLLSANTTDLNVTVTGDLKISKRSDVAGGWSKISQTTAGTLAEDGGSTTGIDGIGASAVYNGSLYVGTGDASGSTAEIYRYDGGSNWTKVSQATAGTIAEDGGSTTGIAKIWSMAVYNGNLYVGTQKTSAGEIYRYDGGSNWTKVSQATAGTIASGGTSGISTAQAMTVYQGNLYVGTFDSGGTEVYRYEGGTTWTRVSNAAGQIDSGGTTNLQDVFGFAVHNDKLHIAVAGSGTGNIAEVYRYEGGTDWTKITPAGVTDQIVSGGTSGIDKVRTIHSYNGTLLIGTTKDGGGAEVYRYDGGTAWTRISQSTAGQIASGDTTGIIGVEAATVYNGKYYIGTRKLTSGGDAEVYRYDGGTTWTKISQPTQGTIIPSGTTDIDEVDTIIVFNNRMYLGTSKTNEAEALYYEAIEGESYRLTFGAASDETATEQSNFLNEGSIKFLAENQAGSVENWTNTGTFEFSHGITTTFGAYDVAEDYPTRDNDILPGTVVSIDQNETGFVTRTNTKQDNTIVGIYSEKPGLRLSQAESHIEGARAIPVALAGRVPVLVTDENGPIMPGDYLTSSSTPGYAMKATQPGPTIGKALGSHMAGSGKVMAFVNISYYSPSTGDILHNQEIKTGALNVQGSAEISGSLNVGGMLEVEDLEVKGSVAIEGNLIVAGSISTKNITINGHIKTAGQTPQIDIAGGIVLGSNTANPAVTIDGNDTSGTITINTESLINPILPGEIVKVTFAESFSKSPKVFINASNADSSSIDIYRESSTNSMLLNITSPLMPGKQYKFDYLVVE